MFIGSPGAIASLALPSRLRVPEALYFDLLLVLAVVVLAVNGLHGWLLACIRDRAPDTWNVLGRPSPWPFPRSGLGGWAPSVLRAVKRPELVKSLEKKDAGFRWIFTTLRCLSGLGKVLFALLLLAFVFIERAP